MSMYAVLRDHPWVRSYWYVGLGCVFVVGLAFVLFDGYTQVNKGKRRAARRAQKQAAAAVSAVTHEEGRIDPTAAARPTTDEARQRRTRRAE